MHVYGARGPLSDTPQLGEYEVVLAWEAKAAIAAAEKRGWDKGYEAGRLDERAELRNHSVAATRAYEQGQRDMLAKCITAVDGLDKYHHGQVDASQALAALRALSSEPALAPNQPNNGGE
jgi:hypothetical protein